MSEGRRAYTPEQLKVLFKFADSYDKNNMRYWLIRLASCTGTIMNEICQFKPENITSEAIYICSDPLNTVLHIF